MDTNVIKTSNDKADKDKDKDREKDKDKDKDKPKPPGTVTPPATYGSL